MLLYSDRMTRVAVLLASYNGAPWLAEQMDSILGQASVELEVFVSDDGSTDGTCGLLASLSARDARVHWSSNPVPQGHAGANFFRLIRYVDVSAFDCIAFADQDDVWLRGKLALQVGQLAAHAADGVSSDVIAFWPSGRTHRLRKSRPQRRYDFVFESPGPGCSMLITPRLFLRLRELLNDDASPARTVGYHDWLIYAVCRASGWAWYIGDEPTLMYRQHEANEMGVNKGPAAWLRRLRRYRQGRFAEDCRAVLAVAADCAKNDGRPTPDLSLLDILRHGRRTWWHRLAIGLMFPHGLAQKNPSTGR